jgi:L-alanine-DL-glutamate epimerase-like enolase superfamily enzyme
MNISLEKLHLDLKVNWKLSRNQTTFKENFIVKLETKKGLFRSEIAPNIRYGETPEKILEQFELWKKKTDLAKISNESELTIALDQSKLLHALRFGLESCFLAYLAATKNESLTEFLKLPRPAIVETSFSMPIIPVNEIADYLAPLTRYKSLKIKVNAETASEMLAEIKCYTSVKLRVDANEGWKDLDSFMRFQESLKGMNIELIEQPFPSSMQAEYRELKKLTPYRLLADESIEDVGDFRELSQQFHAVNIKLMKTGSLIKARDLILEAKRQNMQAMMGCMIETTIGISYGMLFGGMVEYVDLDGFLLIKDEPFKLVTQKDGLLTLEESK